MTGLSVHEQRGIEFGILRNREERDGRRPHRPHLTDDVALHVGDRVIPLGDLPAMSELSDATADKVLEQLADNVRKVLDHTAGEITSCLDFVRLTDHRDAIQTAIRATPRERDAYGPVVAALRGQAGMPRYRLAEAMHRDRSALAAWEAGRPSRLHIGDLARAADALGWSESAIVWIVDYLDDRPPVAAVSRS